MESIPAVQPEIHKIAVKHYLNQRKRVKAVLFTFDFSLTTDGQTYIWRLNKTTHDFSVFKRQLKSEAKMRQMPKPPKLISRLRMKMVYTHLDQKLEILNKYLQGISARSDLCSTLAWYQFAEISINSFTSEIKPKEGYIYKIGSGRVSNQKKCFNCWNCVKGSTKRWIAIYPSGVYFFTSCTKNSPTDVIYFRKNFKILVGKHATQYADGIRLISGQHDFLFRCGNKLRRKELTEIIMKVYQNTDYYNNETKYDSSFFAREGNSAQFFCDGASYFAEVHNAILAAEREIYITDWWLSPDMYLLRPAEDYPNSQIVSVLGQAADRGVKIFVHLWKELTIALSLNSRHTKEVLESRSPNIKVSRHPHVSIRGGEFLWSHHEKLVCIDNKIAFMGGLDLCYGRMDTHSHPLIDIGPKPYWNGIDYTNVRVKDIPDVLKYADDYLDRQTVPRMPWHDLAIKIAGPFAHDLGAHFRDLWNHSVTDITGETRKKEHVINDQPMTRSFKKSLEDMEVPNIVVVYQEGTDHNDVRLDVEGEEEHSGFDLQRRYTSVQKHDHKPRKMYIDPKLYIQQVTKAQISQPTNDSAISIKEAQLPDSVKNIFKKIITGHLNTLNSEVQESEYLKRNHKPDGIEFDTKLNMEREEEEKESAQLAKLFKNNPERWKQHLLQPVIEQQIGQGIVSCQLLRSASLWSLGVPDTESSIQNAYITLISKARRFIYIENQFFISCTAGQPVVNEIGQALVDRIKAAVELQQAFKVIVVLPLLPAFEGEIDAPGSAVLRVQLYWEYMTIARCETSIYAQLRDAGIDPTQYINFYSLRNHAMLNGVPVTEMVYIHSKCMIIDDITVIIGSANINDRSQLGNRDSELAVVLEDNERYESTMAGETVKVSRFAHEFRTSIFSEMSGADVQEISDPFSEEFYNAWERTAYRNTRMYRKVFGCYPDDKMSTYQSIKDIQNMADSSKYQELKERVRGFLVEFPIYFLTEENLKVAITSKEYFLPDSTFT